MLVGIEKYKYIGLIVIILCSILFLNCSEEKKHDILTFLFDGVPPLGQKGIKDVNADLRTTSQVPEGPVWYVHEPRKDCTNCHDKNKQKNMSPQTYLKAPVPQLCYNCHTNYSTSNPYVHGPVAVGQCLYCHNPHASQIKHLLIQSEPDLCYKCHDQYEVELIPSHFSKQISMCTNCHNPHSSSIRSLLRVEPNQINQVYVGRASEQTNITPQIEQDKRNMLQIFSDVNKLIDKGDLQKARLYLLQFKDSSALNEQEREKISELLKLIDDTIAKTNEDGSEKSTTELKPGDNHSSSKGQEIADLYYRSLELYRTGSLIEARDGFIRVINSGLIPPAMEKTIRDYLSDIESRLSKQNK